MLPATGNFEQQMFFFMAENVTRVQTQNLDAGEDIENQEINHGMVLLAFFFFWKKKGLFGA